MNYDQWKKKLYRLFKGEVYRVPSNDWLYSQWEAGQSVEQVETLIRQNY